MTHKAPQPRQPALWNPPRARRIFYSRCAREITAAKDDQLAFWWTHRVADRVGFIRRNRSNTAGAAAPGRASATAPPDADGPRRIRHSGESLDGFESAEASVCARHHRGCRAAKQGTNPMSRFEGGLQGLKANPSAGADDQNRRHARQCSYRTRHSSLCVMCGLGNRTARWTRGLTTPADSLTSPRSSDVGSAPRRVAFVPPSRLY